MCLDAAGQDDESFARLYSEALHRHLPSPAPLDDSTASGAGPAAAGLGASGAIQEEEEALEGVGEEAGLGAAGASEGADEPLGGEAALFLQEVSASGPG